MLGPEHRTPRPIPAATRTHLPHLHVAPVLRDPDGAHAATDALDAHLVAAVPGAVVGVAGRHVDVGVAAEGADGAHEGRVLVLASEGVGVKALGGACGCEGEEKGEGWDCKVHVVGVETE